MRVWKWMLAGAVVVVAAGLAGVPARGRNGATTFEVIGKAPPEDAVTFVRVGPAARHVMWINRSKTGDKITLDGVESRLGFSWGSESFSADGEHTVWIGWDKEGYYVVVDGKEGKPIKGGVETAKLSPDGSQVAYAMQEDKTGAGLAWAVVISGPGGTRKIRATGLPFAFSPDSKRVAYCGGVDGRHPAVVVDGVVGEADEQASIGDIQFSPDGKRLAYVVRTRAGQFCVCDGVEGPLYGQVMKTGFSPDGSKFVSIGTRNVGRDTYDVLAVNGKEVDTFESLQELPEFSADGKHMAFDATDSRGKSSPWLVVVDGVRESTEDKPGDPAVSPDGKHIAYTVGDYVIEDGVRLRADIKGKEIAYDPSFSPDGQHLAFSVCQFVDGGGKPTHAVYGGGTVARYRIILDGVEQSPTYDWMGGPVFSPDSKHVACFALRGKQAYIVVDGKESEPFDGLLRVGTNVVAGKESEPFDRLDHLGINVVFDGPGKVCGIAIKGGQVVRVIKAVP